MAAPAARLIPSIAAKRAQARYSRHAIAKAAMQNRTISAMPIQPSSG
jgi:hypothetical protein